MTFEVTYQNARYNIKSFLKNHPGGLNYLEPYKELDVEKRMKITHSQAATYLLEEYRLELQKHENDLEKLVDWSKPMLKQVGNLGTKYKTWVNCPVDRDLTLFENPLLEMLTITPWYFVPAVWVPVIIYLIKLGTQRYIDLTRDPSPTRTIVLYIFLGLILWSFIEYSLHRWVFHMEPTGKSKLLIYVHFIMHGLHHKVPFDTRRLVFPPAGSAIIGSIIYKIVSLIVPDYMIILLAAGGFSGYLMYDMIHFYLHCGAPKENSYFYHLKRYHNQHHFAQHNSGFGISSTFWDQIFGTVINLRSLATSIRW
ncbi:unnamed protein product [Ceutorhynchus assimilis]|uniref:Fatty acid hydroxylase domain-containing protein n=1 Tax=Ceutorhynchus assimilis TaxID=467358 RepID=A0A9N9MM07_9CUCU|nr:unnamed protein product [Ceutorhynchus assimilis]